METIDRYMIYNSISETLLKWEEEEIEAGDLYEMLVYIRDNWDIITKE